MGCLAGVAQEVKQQAEICAWGEAQEGFQGVHLQMMRWERTGQEKR